MTKLIRGTQGLTGNKLRYLFQSAALLLLLLAVLTAPAAADNATAPNLPVQFYGTLYNETGEPAPAGTVLIASVNGVTSTYMLTEAGKIGGSGTFDDKLLISGLTDGDTIIFSIEGGTDNVTYHYTETAGDTVVELILYIPPLVTPEFSDPVITPAGGVFIDICNVTITAGGNNTIYYTTDGTDPRDNGNIYTGFFPINETTTVKAIAVNGNSTSNITTAVFTKEIPPSIFVPDPVISPNGGTFSEKREVTIQADIGTIYYTTDGTNPTAANDNRYTGAFSITETTTVKAIAIADTGEMSKIVEAIFLKDQPEQTYTITVLSGNGGNITTDKAVAKADDLVTVTFTADEGWLAAGWTITGETTGTVSEKTTAVSSFAMWRENVVITGKFTEDTTPKAASVSVARVPVALYASETVKDTGYLTATVYDQFGNIFSKEVIWSSGNEGVITIDANGQYAAVAPGQTIITATAAADSRVATSYIITVYNPPMPKITSAINHADGFMALYGVQSAPFIFDTEYTSALNIDWGDTSFDSVVQANSPYPIYLTSQEAITHAFTSEGTLTASVTPVNSYNTGEAKSFTVKVAQPIPANLGITDGPKSVTGGETATYTASATNANSYIWYVDGQEIGQTGATASITFPDVETTTVVEVSVKAVNNGGSTDAVTKTVTVAVAGGELGTFGALTTNPTKPVVGELTTFNIEAVENAVKYHWVFANGNEYDTTAPGAAHTLTGTGETSVTVTAYNSADKNISKEYTIAGIGEKPVVSLSAKNATVTYGGTTSLTATGTAGTYAWYLDGEKVEGASSAAFTKAWTLDDIGTHTISVVVTTDYGTATDLCVISVENKKGAKPDISPIVGKHIVSENADEFYSVIVYSKDAYTITWYVNGKEIKSETITEGTGFLKSVEHQYFNYAFTSTGKYTIDVVVTTEFQETDSASLTIEVISSERFDSNKAKDQEKKEGQKDPVNPKLHEGSEDKGKHSLESVEDLSFDKKDINEDGDPVSVTITALDQHGVKEFTHDMGQKGNMLLGLDIQPTGIKNEKDLTSYAILKIKLLVSEVGDDPSKVSFYRYDTGSDVNGWEVLSFAQKPYLDESGNFWVYSIQTGGMSQFVATLGTASSEADSTTLPSTSLTPVTDTRDNLSAITAAEVSYTLTAVQLSELPVHTLTYGSRSIIMNESVLVTKTDGTTVQATISTDGKVTLNEAVNSADALTVTFEGRKLGDVYLDKVVDTFDASTLLRCCVELEEFTPNTIFYGDVDGDGSTDTFDASKILQYSVELVDENYDEVKK